MVGVMYCTMPSVASFSRRPASRKHTSGTTVTTPAANNSKSVFTPRWPMLDCPLYIHQTIPANAIGARSNVSMVRPSMASNPAILRISP